MDEEQQRAHDAMVAEYGTGAIVNEITVLGGFQWLELVDFVARTEGGEIAKETGIKAALVVQKVGDSVAADQETMEVLIPLGMHIALMQGVSDLLKDRTSNRLWHEFDDLVRRYGRTGEDPPTQNGAG